MPLFLRHRVLFLHIPKCGGDTFSHALRRAGDPPFLFVPDGSVLTNGHTPQHMTWRELCAAGWQTPSDFRVLTFVRHPLDRVLSAFRYIHLARPDLVHMAKTPSQFLDHFYSTDPVVKLRFDHHNLGILEFLKNAEGQIDPEIEIHHMTEMDQVLESLGLPAVPNSERRNVTQEQMSFSQSDLDRIGQILESELIWYQSRFPKSER